MQKVPNMMNSLTTLCHIMAVGGGGVKGGGGGEGCCVYVT